MKSRGPIWTVLILVLLAVDAQCAILHRYEECGNGKTRIAAQLSSNSLSYLGSQRFALGTELPGSDVDALLQEQSSANSGDDETQDCIDREAYHVSLLRDPKTGTIPDNIRSRELEYARRLSAASSEGTKAQTRFQSAEWISRGPVNIGGRTHAIGIDIVNEDIILAGGTTGGMWRSTDRGLSWTQTTGVSALPSTSCLAQDIRSGKTNTWYFGTGEFNYTPSSGNTGGYPMGRGEGVHKWGEYYGNGIYKSVDGGLSWSVLTSTVSESVGMLIQPFNFVFRVAIDPSNAIQDVVYAAVPGGIERSSNGGQSWQMVLGDFPDGASRTDVTVTSSGVVYAVICSNLNWKGLTGSAPSNESTRGGIYRSVDGIHWIDITPPTWNRSFYMPCIAHAPSNTNVVYIALDSMQNANQSTGTLWKYTYKSGDGSGTGGTVEERATNPMNTWVLAVAPNDENTVVMGGVLMFMSTDGFASQGSMSNLTPPHYDQFEIAFSRSKPSSLIVGCDGGLFQTNDLRASSPVWNSLNNNYLTVQFYTVAIDHSASGDQTLIGGMQDNNSMFTNSVNKNKPWTVVQSFDGTTCAIADKHSAYYVSWQFGHAYRKLLDDAGTVLSETRIDPIGPTTYPWVNPFCLDPNVNNRMYFGGGPCLWRNDDLASIPMKGSNPTSVAWTKLSSTALSSIDSIIRMPLISAICCSRTPTDRVYYGTNDGRLFKIDGAQVDGAVPQQIWEARGFPKLAYVNSIAVDQANADKVIVAFSNYNVQSLFSSDDGGATWVPIGGNLEQNSDGTGNGPSIRSASIMHTGNETTYFVGTSTGLYSTHILNGMSTVWIEEGTGSIGNSIVNMVDVRESDGMVAVATCGHGVYSKQFNAPSSVNEIESNSFNARNSPNPFNPQTTIEFTLENLTTVNISIYDVNGVIIRHLVCEMECNQGLNEVSWDGSGDHGGRVPPGTYFAHVCVNQHVSVVKMCVTGR